jgi:acetyltransferase-like isoleucine patch superfamily enzyme
VKSPVRIGPDVWIGAKASVLRGTTIGRGCVVAAHAVVRGDVPDYAIVGGIPARVLKDRREVYDAQVERREALADIARKTALAADRNAGADGPTVAGG